MAARTGSSRAAGEYAKALLALANERNEAQAVAEDLHQLARILAADPVFRLFLIDPRIGTEQRWAVLQRIFGTTVRPLLLNMLGVLNRRWRLSLIPQIAEQFQMLLDRQLGNIQVRARVAHELDASLLEGLRQRIRQVFEKNAVVRQEVDDSLIGGLVLYVEDHLIDGSVKTQLNRLKEQMFLAAAR